LAGANPARRPRPSGTRQDCRDRWLAPRSRKL
jgi:hypothetical protein